MLDPKETCPTPIPNSETEETCNDLAGDLSLSWILIDPTWLRAVNLSSHKPVSVQRHWLSSEVHARFATVLAAGEKGSASEFVQCGIVVTCGSGGDRGEMHVRGASLQVEDMDGVFLDGKGSLEILKSGFEGKKGINGRREMEGGKRYEMFLEMKRDRKERKLKNERTLDMLCVTFGVMVFVSLGLFLLLR
ncbi:unnamed protein product [Dovyalis caffra]|uniref:F-box protein n=1 Tax=Dovyalis caffra TaxID=77055 RepID=A0AAV1S0Y4_9ROSI|nr:unnamed protein product [Dovyalis caffra]